MRHEVPGFWRLVQAGEDGFAAQDGQLRIVVSWGGGWDHVSVSRVDRPPVWREMCRVKRAMFEAEETVVQYHPGVGLYVNEHPNCLHLWRPQNTDLPMPPLEFV